MTYFEKWRGMGLITPKNRTRLDLVNYDALKMMRTANIHEAKTQFSRLVDAAASGTEIVIAKAGKPAARLVPIKPEKPARRFGALKGKLLLKVDHAIAAGYLHLYLGRNGSSEAHRECPDTDSQSR